jgi:hypothetical protein
MRCLQVTGRDAAVHLALRNGDRVRVLRQAHDGIATTLDLLTAIDDGRVDADSWTQGAERAGAFEQARWADLEERRQLTLPLTPPEVWGAGVTYKRSADFREEGSGIYDRVYAA